MSYLKESYLKMQKQYINHSKDGISALRDQFVAGDDKAYAELYNLYSKELYAMGLFLCKDRRLIEDALHDVFTNLFLHRNLLSKVENLKYYLFSSFRHRLFYLIKKENNKADLDDWMINTVSEKNFSDVWIENEEVNEKNQNLKRLLSYLNDHQREVLYQRFVQGMSIGEIANLLQINYQSVKNIIQRALKKMKDMSSVDKIYSIAIIILLTSLNTAFCC